MREELADFVDATLGYNSDCLLFGVSHQPLFLIPGAWVNSLPILELLMHLIFTFTP